MTHRALILAVSAALTAGALADDAEANHRKKRLFYGYGSYYPGPGYYIPPPPRYYRYYDGPEYGYYDPYYDPAIRKVKKKKKIAKTPSRALKKKTVKSQAAAPKKTVKSVTATEQPEPTKEPVAKKEPVKTAATKSTPVAQTETKSKAATSCEKAGTILSGYGFTDIKPSVCTGKEYTFDAARDGKIYAIKLNPANGELTEVRKVR